MTSLAEIVYRAALEAIETAVTRVPKDVFETLKRFAELESDARAKRVLHTMIEAVKVAAREGTPLCQDTGFPTFIVRIGSRFPAKRASLAALRKAVVEATRRGVLRPNVVDPVTNRNSGTNVGRQAPHIVIDVFRGDEIEVIFVPRGGGCEGVSKLVSLSPSQGWRGLVKAVIDAVVEAGPKPCPPVFLFVGVAGTASLASYLATMCVTRRCGSRAEGVVGELEEKLLAAVNRLGIGPMGLGGRTTALDVRLCVGSRHPATFVASIQFSCWALRRARFVVGRDGSVWLDPNDFWSP